MDLRTRTSALIRGRPKPAAGSNGPTSRHSECQVLAVHAGGEQADLSGHLEPFSISAPVFLLESVRSVSSYRLRRSRCAAFGLRGSFHPSLVTPTEALLAPPEAGEIAAACRAAVGSRAHAQQEHDPARRMIVLLAPRGEFLAVAAGAACVPPSAFRPYAGLPAMAATAATQGINTEDAAEHLRDASPVRHTRLAATAFRARKLHFPSSITTTRLRPIII
jgi:hypothetical protein